MRQIINLGELRRSAMEAVLGGKTLADCPEEYLAFEEDWQQAFRKAAFDVAAAKSAEGTRGIL